MCIFSADIVIQHIQKFLQYDIQIHTNVQYVHVHTDTACVQHVNVGLAHSLIPSPSLQLSPVAVWILSIICTASDNSCGEGLGMRLARSGSPQCQKSGLAKPDYPTGSHSYDASCQRSQVVQKISACGLQLLQSQKSTEQRTADNNNIFKNCNSTH